MTTDVTSVATRSTNLYEDEAQHTIRKYTIIAAGGGLLPNPLLSFAATTGLQLLMIRELCNLYRIDYDKNLASVAINSVAGSIATTGVSFAVSSFIPGSNPIVGFDVSGAAIAGIYTATVGAFYKDHFQRGGTLEDASIGDLGHYLLDEIQNGNLSVSKLTNPTYLVQHVMKLN
ncbi:MAG: DUF697 domain-containing protein [Bacteroidota bacterium]